MTPAVSSLLKILGLWIFLVLFCVSGTKVATRSSVEYKVEGHSTRSVSVTYANADGGTDQIAVAEIPWSIKFKCKAGEFLYISAQNKQDAGVIIAQIIIDGRQDKLSVSSGGYVIAAASSRCPY